MRNRFKDYRPVPDPLAIILALCEGPRTRQQLAQYFHCRPACMDNALSILRQCRLIMPLRGTSPDRRHGFGDKLDLAIDPAAAFALLRARITEHKKTSKKCLRGSPEYLHYEAARQGGASPHSDSAPLGTPAGGGISSGRES